MHQNHRPVIDDELFRAALAQTERETAERHVRVQLWEPGAVGLDSQGHNGGLYCVQHGRLELMVRDANGGERSLRLMGAGDIFGLECLLPQPPGGYQVRALTRSAVIAVNPELVDRWILSCPDFRRALANRLASGICHLEQEREHTLSRPVSERLLCYLICGESCQSESAERHPGHGPLPMQVLARRLGCSAGHLSRAARRLLQSGVVQRTHGGLQIGDLSRFEGALCEGCRKS